MSAFCMAKRRGVLDWSRRSSATSNLTTVLSHNLVVIFDSCAPEGNMGDIRRRQLICLFQKTLRSRSAENKKAASTMRLFPTTNETIKIKYRQPLQGFHFPIPLGSALSTELLNAGNVKQLFKISGQKSLLAFSDNIGRARPLWYFLPNNNERKYPGTRRVRRGGHHTN
jgi:hypothetical protein